jgi:hypothetical protein
MRRLVGVALCLGLTGCSFSGLISSQTVDYNATIETANNQLLLANVLRARDHAPLYFSDLSQIRGSITLTTSDSETLPFGKGRITTNKEFGNSLSGSLQSAPTFDIVPLNQQTFTQGIVQPLELQFAKYYWDRLDYPEYTLASLFVDKIEVDTELLFDLPGKGETKCTLTVIIPNKPGSTSSAVVNPPDPCRAILANIPKEKQAPIPKSFDDAIQEWGIDQAESPTLRNITFQSYTAGTKIGGPVSLTSAGVKDLTGFDPEKFRLIPVKAAGGGTEGKTTYQLYALSQHVVICPPSQYMASLQQGKFNILLVAPEILGTGSNTTINVTPRSPSACGTKDIVYDLDQTNQINPKNYGTKTITIYTRSVEGMFQYLGALLKQNEDHPELKNPLGFYVGRGQSPSARISFSYLDGDYYVAPDGPDDHTLQILGLVEQLLNLRKDSKEIMTTPASQSVP